VRMASSALTRVGTAVGTLNYMAPEQVRGETCTAASDVFATGIVFYLLSTGQHPFTAGRKSMPEILSAILFEQPPAWAEQSGAPQGLEFVIRRALEKDPAKRWQNAGDLRQALSLCRFTLENQPVPAAAAPPPAPDLAKTRVVPRYKPRPQPVPPPRLQARYCPSCTHANVMEAVVCARCGVPLVAPGAAAPPPSSSLLWIWIGAAALLLAVLLVLWMLSR
jgi:serine/threonine protein kinase